MTYQITQDYIQLGNSRSGIKNLGIKFIVSHDTGNEGSTAYNNRSHFNNNQPKASAQTFIDDKYILEIIPRDEKAWHVMYDKPTDNQMFGDDSNDIAIGVELCWGGKIDFKEAYNRFVWYHAYLCHEYNLNPLKHIVSHKILDPERKTDPDNALNRYGITWEQFLNDVYRVYRGREKEEDTLLKLTDSQFNMLTKAYKNAYDKKILSSSEWHTKAAKKELTIDEAVFLNAVIMDRLIK